MPMNPKLLRPRASNQPGVPSGTPASLLLRFDGTNGSTSFVDSSPNALTVTAYGDAQISTAQSKFGGSSGYFDGSSSLKIESASAFDFGTGDFTIELWLFIDQAQSGNQYIYDLGSNNAPFTAQSPAGPTVFNWLTNITGPSASVPDNTWAHFAVVRSGGTVTLYKDGVAAGSFEDTGSYSSTELTIGDYGGGGYALYGYIDDLRIVKGLAVYTANFTPPTGPLSPYANPQ